MALDPVTAVSGLAKTVIETFFPNKTESERAELAAAVSMVQGQLEINKAEAASPSVFTSGWRPFIGWTCGAACAWNWVGLPVAVFVAKLVDHPLVLEMADLTEMLPLLLGMLGLGGFRTYEKVRKVSR